MEITVYDKEFTPFCIVDDYVSFIWTDRYAKYGDFELYSAVTSSILENLRPGYYLTIRNSDRMMIVEDIVVDTNPEDGDRVTITGKSLESILDRRIVWTQTTLNGNLQNGIKKLIDENIISPSKESRKISNFIFEASTDKAITDLTIDAQYTGDNLYDVVTSLCEEHEIGFKITLNDKNQFVFKLYKGADRSYEQNELPYVVFSPGYENLLTANYKEETSEYKNVALIGGEGEGADRKYEAVGDTSGLDRRELFVDARDISSNIDSETTMSLEDYKKLLYQRGEEKMSEYKLKTEFEGEADTSIMFQFGIDFFIGDLVQISDAYGHEGTSRVVEIVNSTDDTGSKTYPVFETPEKGDET